MYLFKKLPRNLDMKELLQSPELHEHIVRFEEIIEVLLSKAKNNKDFVNTLIDFGKLHHKLGAQQKYATVKCLLHYLILLY